MIEDGGISHALAVPAFGRRRQTRQFVPTGPVKPVGELRVTHSVADIIAPVGIEHLVDAIFPQHARTSDGDFTGVDMIDANMAGGVPVNAILGFGIADIVPRQRGWRRSCQPMPDRYHIARPIFDRTTDW